MMDFLHDTSFTISLKCLNACRTLSSVMSIFLPNFSSMYVAKKTISNESNIPCSKKSSFLIECEKKGAKTINGLEMLQSQAEESWIIWNSMS